MPGSKTLQWLFIEISCAVLIILIASGISTLYGISFKVVSISCLCSSLISFLGGMLVAKI